MRLRRSHKRPDQRRDGALFFKPAGRQWEPPTTAGFFARPAPEQDPVSTAAIDERREEGAEQTVDDRDLARQDEREEETAATQADKREEETAAKQADKREEETAAKQADRREDETVARQADERDDRVATQDERDEVTAAAQADMREDETAARQGDERDEPVATQDEREEETAAAQADKREDETAARQGDEREDQVATQDDREEAEPTPAQAPSAGARIARQAAAAPSLRQPTEAPRQDLAAPRFAGDRRLEAALDNRRTVRRGDRGDHVMRLQQALVDLGFQLPGVGVDGRFGSETEQAVRAYQAAHGLAIDGIVGPETMGDLDRRLHLPMLDWAGSLRDRLRQLIAQGEVYARLRAEVQTAWFLDRIFALLDRAFLREIAGRLAWDDFARIVELLGRGAPDGNALIGNAAVQAALADAWTDSHPAVTSWDVDDPAHPSHANCSPSVSPNPRAAVTGTHEEGGWIYLNLITGGVYTRRAPHGAQAAIPLANPPQILDSIVVGAFHTHPNLGACWGAQPGAGDIAFSRFVGVPLLARGMVGAATRDFVTPAPAPQRRAHLAGPRDYPHAGGALAPQADRYATRAGSVALS